ncbi:MAG: MarC family protein [Puniceicoccales bacterium]|jgi:multiple antibiotic resistance protein|nr:MarC family protein [Puniceicoccales bacterium]
MNADISLIQLFCVTIIQIYIILNPPSVIAVMLGLTNRNTIEERLLISKQVSIIGGLLLFTFAFFGQIILDDVFHISTEAFQVGGGLYLFTIGLSMLLPKNSQISEDTSSSEKSAFNFVITPLATPLLTGPGTITAILVKRTEIPDAIPYICAFYGALMVTMILVYCSFFLGCKFSKYLTPFLLEIVEKLVGVLLACIAIKSILKGITTFVQCL